MFSAAEFIKYFLTLPVDFFNVLLIELEPSCKFLVNISRVVAFNLRFLN